MSRVLKNLRVMHRGPKIKTLFKTRILIVKQIIPNLKILHLDKGAIVNFDNFWTNLSDSVQCLVHAWVVMILLSEEFIFVWKPKTSKLEHQRHYQAMGSKPKDQFDLEHYLYFLNKIQLLINCAKLRQSVWNWMARMRRRCQAKTNNTSNIPRGFGGLTSYVNRIIDFKSDWD